MKFLITKTGPALFVSRPVADAITQDQVYGNARIFEGSAPPTNEQMAALFAPATPSPIDLAQAAITKAYPVLVLLDGQSKIFQHTAAGTVQTVKAMAIAGQTNFPPAPNTVAEVLAE